LNIQFLTGYVTRFNIDNGNQRYLVHCSVQFHLESYWW